MTTLADAHYVVVPDSVWLGQEAPPPEPEWDREATGTEEYYLPPPEPKPLSLAALTTIGGTSGALTFGVVAGMLATSPIGLLAGVAAGVFGGMMGSSLAEEVHDHRRR